jgi:hypothetical protein
MVDLFVENPMNFERFYDHAVARSLGSTTVRVASVPPGERVLGDPGAARGEMLSAP